MDERSDTGVSDAGDAADGPDRPDGPGDVPARASSPVPEPRGGRDLPTAIAVGVVLAVVFVGSLLVDPGLFTAVVVVLTVVAVWEAGTELATTQHSVARPVLVVAAVVTGVATHSLGVQGQVLGVLVLVFGAFGWELASQPRRDVVGKLGTTLLIGGWVVFLASFAVLLVVREQGHVAATLVVAGAAIVGDIGAYATGRLVGRRPIAPTVSPNKTWEGMVGGVLVAAGVAALVMPMVDDVLFADPLDAALVAALCAFAGFVGDLAESMVKRDVGLKDLGDLLPGHGGMLDRLDGVLLALPVGYYALELLT